MMFLRVAIFEILSGKEAEEDSIFKGICNNPGQSVCTWFKALFVQSRTSKLISVSSAS